MSKAKCQRMAEGRVVSFRIQAPHDKNVLQCQPHGCGQIALERTSFPLGPVFLPLLDQLDQLSMLSRLKDY